LLEASNSRQQWADGDVLGGALLQHRPATLDRTGVERARVRSA